MQRSLVLAGSTLLFAGCVLGPSFVGETAEGSGTAGGGDAASSADGTGTGLGASDGAVGDDAPSGVDSTTGDGCDAGCPSEPEWATALAHSAAALAILPSGEIGVLQIDTDGSGWNFWVERLSSAGESLGVTPALDIPADARGFCVLDARGDAVALGIWRERDGYHVQRRSADLQSAVWTATEPGDDLEDGTDTSLRDVRVLPNGEILVLADFQLDDIPPIIPHRIHVRSYTAQGDAAWTIEEPLPAPPNALAFLGGNDTPPYVWSETPTDDGNTMGLSFHRRQFDATGVTRDDHILIDGPIFRGPQPRPGGWITAGPLASDGGITLQFLDDEMDAAGIAYDVEGSGGKLPAGRAVFGTASGATLFSGGLGNGAVERRRYDHAGTLLERVTIPAVTPGAELDGPLATVQTDDDVLFGVFTESDGDVMTSYVRRIEL